MATVVLMFSFKPLWEHGTIRGQAQDLSCPGVVKIQTESSSVGEIPESEHKKVGNRRNYFNIGIFARPRVNYLRRFAMKKERFRVVPAEGLEPPRPKDTRF